MNDWNKVWNKRKIDHATNDDLLLSLIKLDGFDNGVGEISLQDWIKYIAWIKKKLKVEDKDSIFEVGCGSGAFIYPFYKMGNKVSGIDYSKTLIKYIRNSIPNMKFNHCEALKLDPDEKFDIVISNSVFQYFANYDYAEKVIRLMLDKAVKKIAVLVINNINKKDEILIIRKDILNEEKKNKTTHLFYKKDFFINIAKEHNYNIEIFSQNINNYGNNSFRFNVIITKK